MASLELKLVPPNGIVLNPAGYITSMAELRQWKQIVRKSLLYAFHDRSACFITVEPKGWSIGRELTEEPAVLIDGKPYLLAYRENCSFELLTAVSESEDFERGLLWLTSLKRADAGRIFRLIRSAALSARTQFPETCEELFRSVGDGEVIQWFNPARPLQTMLNSLTEMTQDVGWNVSVASNPRKDEK